MIHQHKWLLKASRGSAPWGKEGPVGVGDCRFSTRVCVGGLIWWSMCLDLEAPLGSAILDRCVLGSNSWACESKQRELWPWGSHVDSNHGVTAVWTWAADPYPSDYTGPVTWQWPKRVPSEIFNSSLLHGLWHQESFGLGVPQKFLRWRWGSALCGR